MVSNYLNNVDGEIYKDHYYRNKSERGQTLYVIVPANASLIIKSISYFIGCFSIIVEMNMKILCEDTNQDTC